MAARRFRFQGQGGLSPRPARGGAGKAGGPAPPSSTRWRIRRLPGGRSPASRAAAASPRARRPCPRRFTAGYKSKLRKPGKVLTLCAPASLAGAASGGRCPRQTPPGSGPAPRSENEEKAAAPPGDRAGNAQGRGEHTTALVTSHLYSVSGGF